MSCAIANAVLDVIQDEHLMERANRVGTHLLDRCKDLKLRHRLVGDVRGRGLFVGVELVTDRDARTPATAEAKHIVNRLVSYHKFQRLSVESVHCEKCLVVTSSAI